MADVKVYFIVNLKINDAETYRKYEKGFLTNLKKHGGEIITYYDNIVNAVSYTNLTLPTKRIV